MAFIAMLFVMAVLIGAPLCGIFFLALSLIFRRLHRKYRERTLEARPKKWRRVLAIIFGIFAGINLLTGAAGWVFFMINMIR